MEIRVLIDNSPGTMARVITTMRRLGLALEGQRMVKSAEAEHSELVVEAGGPVTASDISQSLRDIKGVVKILNIGEASASARSRPETKPERGGGSNAVKGNIVDQIVEAYPKILRYVDAFESDIRNSKERGVRLQTLGQQVGERLMQGNTELDACDTIRDALAILVPILKPIADVRALGSEIYSSVSIFTRRQINTMDLVFGAEASKCDFMTGLIQGIINSAPMLPQVAVTETACRTNGDDECIFHVA